MNYNVTWLGQGGFLFELDGFRLAVDPYLSTVVEQREGLHRLMQAPVTLDELRPDAIVCTHNHLDHYDPLTVPELMRRFPACVLAGPESVRVKALSDGIDAGRFLLLDCGGKISCCPFGISGIKAVHSDKLAIGLMIKAGGKNIYVSGDTEYFAELPDAIKAGSGGVPDLMFICINGKCGNMTSEQARETVKAVRPSAAVPMHYGMFAENTVSPDAFAAGCRSEGIPVRILEPGQVWKF